MRNGRPDLYPGELAAACRTCYSKTAMLGASTACRGHMFLRSFFCCFEWRTLLRDILKLRRHWRSCLKGRSVKKLAQAGCRMNAHNPLQEYTRQCASWLLSESPCADGLACTVVLLGSFPTYHGESSGLVEPGRCRASVGCNLLIGSHSRTCSLPV